MTRKYAKNAGHSDWNANAHYRDDKVAADYDSSRFSSLPGRVFNELERRVVRRAFSDLPAGSKVADIPCGTGRLAEPLLSEGYRVHGMDISGQMLEVAVRRLTRFGEAFTTEVVDAKSLDRTHERYAGVLCARVLMHFPLDEQIEFLRGVTRITDGRVVINHSLSSPYQRFRRAIKRALGHQPPARFPINDEQITILLSAAGLREVRRFRLNRLVSEAIYIVAQPTQT